MKSIRGTSEPDLDSAPEPEHIHDSFRLGWVHANVWLLFLVFPLLSVVADDLSPSRKGVAAGLIVAFAGVHMLGYRELIRRELGLATDLGPGRSALWFATLIGINAVGFLVGGWPLLAVVPFIVSFAVFHFSWRTAAFTGAVSFAIVLILPALSGVLSDAWVFSVLVLSVGAATGMIRMNIDGQREQVRLITQLVVSQERERVARDVHDVLGHSLTVVILKTQVCDRLLESLDGTNTERVTDSQLDAVVEQTRAQLAEAESVSRRALAEIRATVGGLRSADLADELAAARVVLADADVELTIIGEANEIASHQRSLMGWVVREAITNVVRHARATQCEVHLAPAGHSASEVLLLRISDNGVGLGASRPGNGLAGLQERVDADGATLRVTSSNGTTIEVVVPSPENGA